MDATEDAVVFQSCCPWCFWPVIGTVAVFGFHGHGVRRKDLFTTHVRISADDDEKAVVCFGKN